MSIWMKMRYFFLTIASDFGQSVLMESMCKTIGLVWILITLSAFSKTASQNAPFLKRPRQNSLRLNKQSPQRSRTPRQIRRHLIPGEDYTKDIPLGKVPGETDP
jgi:hypothetical protein